jgi:hypothetical protein
MAVTSRRQTDRFTPERHRDKPDAPVYIIAPLTYWERARFNADLVYRGVTRYPSNAEIIKAVRKALDDVDPDTAAPFIAIVEAYQAAEIVTRDGTSDAAEVSPDLIEAYQVIEDQMRVSPLVGRLMAARTMFSMLAPPLAASHALRGWVNVDLPFRQSNGVVPDDLLDRLDAVDVIEIGGRALELMRPGDEDRKNSEPPSGSPEGQEISQSS